MRIRSCKSQLWHDSPTTLHYTSPCIIFPKSRRFERNSIYWPSRNQSPISALGLKNIWDEEMKAISKKIDDEERLERSNQRESLRRLSLISRSIDEKRFDRRLSHYVKPAPSTLSSFDSTIVTRLFEKSPKGGLNFQRDRRGLRSDQIVDQNQIILKQLNPQTTKSSSLRKRGFSYSKRIDLSRPENFNPGPGSYKIVRFLEHQKRRSRGEITVTEEHI